MLTAEGRVNVTMDGDTLRQLPDAPLFYEKGRSANVTADTHKNPVAFATTLLARTALLAIGRSFKNDTNSLISYNDISLPKGGLFDFLAIRPPPIPPDPVKPDRPWLTPHSTHRRGMDVDVNKPNQVPCSGNTSVQKAVNIVLARDTDPKRLGKTALLCESTGNYHIFITELRVPEAFKVLFGL
ncbi:MAG TPA: hypothetical protein PKH39_17900 [Woeseiaceae bacterium]|nr:hypothetical protein [Woeseiaceae bacterium]